MYFSDDKCDECSRTKTARLLSWIERRKLKKNLKRQNKIIQASQEAARISQEWQTEKLDKLRYFYQSKLSTMRERLDAYAAENQEIKDKLRKMSTFYREKQAYLQESVDAYAIENVKLKDTVCQLKKKVSKLEMALCNETESAAQRYSKPKRYEVNPGVFTSSTRSTPEMESLQTKILSLEFTVFRQHKLMELMEETLQAFEPNFSVKTLGEVEC
ncbi:uncharacterized protein LOC121384464 isoform X2 [Gigantopelta aegis]|uniref:uncharacterized protein LOC121384464 isoform X2 n=1 Tax=Gigantopelta aegis TaxID=1735272 RepID=UPI001B8874FB|nr:uncharacterized protein LOC121384464 isoform X2 [Gigantopelta aegis]